MTNSERTTSAWERGYSALLGYLDEHGDACPPVNHVTANGFRLGQWVATQRCAHRRGRLTQERAGRLAAQPGWLWEARAAGYQRSALAAERRDRWETGLAALCDYVADNGNAQPPTKYIAANGVRLGSWASLQRTAHRLGYLPAAQARRLEAVPGWTWKVAYSWDEALDQLVAYADEHGHAHPPQRYRTASGFRLGHWAAEQRRLYWGDRLGFFRQRRLEGLPGWLWGTMHTVSWDTAFGQLLAYADEHGHAHPPDRYVTSDGLRLGGWVHKQRRAYRQGLLPADRQHRLEELPGWLWDGRVPRIDVWDNAFSQLIAYVDEHGHAHPPEAYVTGDGFRLGRWVQCQRLTYMRGLLAADRQHRLEELPGWLWDGRIPRIDVWDNAFGQLLAYVNEHGHAHPPQRYVTSDGFRLGVWVAVQRVAHRRDRLASDRRRQLEALPGWLWNGLAAGQQRRQAPHPPGKAAVA